MLSRDELRKIPKVELHRHLEGSCRLQTLVEESHRHGIKIPSPVQVLTPESSLSAFLKAFDNIHAVFLDTVTIERIAFEAVLDAHADGVVLLELRYAPTFISEKHNHDMQHVFDAIEKGILRAQTEVDHAIAVGIIITSLGVSGLQAVWDSVAFAVKNRSRIVGFDMAGVETNLGQWKECFAAIHSAGIPITCHASEDKVDGLPINALIAARDLNAQRIGHGIQIYKEPHIVHTLAQMGVHLEVCILSNYLTNAISHLEVHPVREFISEGISVSLNTDDPGVMGINLIDEYEVWNAKYGFSHTDLLDLNRRALEHSFLSKEEKERIRLRYF